VSGAREPLTARLAAAYILNTLVCWGCLLMASLMAWHHRFAKSPCSRPHRPREKQGVRGALTLLAWCTMLPCTETSNVPGLNRGLQLAVPSHRRELQTAVSTSAGLTSALADTAVSRIVLASGTYNLIAELSITRSVILEAAAGATVTLNAQASSTSRRRVVNINPGSSGVVQLIGLGITGGYYDVGGARAAETLKFPIAPMGKLLTCLHRLTLDNCERFGQLQDYGGGFYVAGGTVAISSCTISGNRGSGVHIRAQNCPSLRWENC